MDEGYFKARNSRIEENSVVAVLTPEQTKTLDNVIGILQTLSEFSRTDVLETLGIDCDDLEKAVEDINVHFNYQPPDEEDVDEGPEPTDGDALASAGRGTDEDYGNASETL